MGGPHAFLSGSCVPEYGLLQHIMRFTHAQGTKSSFVAPSAAAQTGHRDPHPSALETCFIMADDTAILTPRTRDLDGWRELATQLPLPCRAYLDGDWHS